MPLSKPLVFVPTPLPIIVTTVYSERLRNSPPSLKETNGSCMG
eukprot:XP_001705966.1 Hypothetical protein GL50803_118284 [Giardia lamblia ATCC 50803]